MVLGVLLHVLQRQQQALINPKAVHLAGDFVHGGIQLLDLGVDLQVSPRFTFSADGVAFAWDDPKTLGTILGLAETPDAFAATEAIGQLKLRPFLNEQALIALSAAALVPAPGLTDVTGSSATEVKGDVRVILAF